MSLLDSTKKSSTRKNSLFAPFTRTIKEYNKKGNLYSEYEYKTLPSGENVRDGMCVKYHTKGSQKVKSIIYYKDGIKHGSFKVFFINGRLRIESSFYEGSWNGEYKQWHSNGQLRMSGVLEKHGKKSSWVGIMQTWNKDGSPSGYYNKGKRLGKDKEEALEGQFHF